jgi:beta-lactamase class A/LysM repeat protein
MVGLNSWTVVQAVEPGHSYVVRPGDTLGGIGASLGVSVDSLTTLNSLDDPSQLVAGQTLAVSAQTETAAAPAAGPGGAAGRDYLVQPGDTLGSIAQREQIPLGALLAANGLTDANRIVVGQKLKLPAQNPAGNLSGGSSPLDSGQPGGGSPSAAPAASQVGAGSEVASLLHAAATRHRLDPATVKALAWHLSGWRTEAAEGSGPVGPMQVTSATQDWVAKSLLKRQVDRVEPSDNVDIGVAYLAYLVERQGDERLGLAAYLQGPTGLARDGLTAATARALEQVYNLRSRFISDQAVKPAPPEPARPAAGGQAATGLLEALPAEFQRLAGEARVGVAARHLKTGAQVGLHANEVFPSASVNKVAILAEALRQIEARTIARSPELNADLSSMIVLSDNDAANRVLDAVGERNVNATMARLGFGKTVLHNYFSYALGPIDPGYNQTTPSDMAGLLTLLATDKLVSPAASQEMRGLLLQAQDASKLRRGLPAEARLAHKSGFYTGVANDAGIIFGPSGSYVLAVFSQGVADAEQGNELVAGVSRLLYEAWGR